MQILTENETYALIIEKVANQWWLELIEKKRGTSQILYCKTKTIAENFFKIKGTATHYLSFEKIKYYYEKIGVKETKMYKENLDFRNLI